MNRLLLSASLLLTAGLAAAADITYETRATTLDKALEALSQQNNVAIKAVGPIARQVVVVSVNKQPLDVFLKHLAKALSATTNLTNGVYEISESANLLRAEEDAERAEMAKGFAKSLAEQSKTLDGPALSELELHKRLTDLKRVMEQLQQNTDSLDNDVYEKAQALQESIPTAQLVRRLLLTIPPADLAALPTDQRVVFANNPTRMQRPLNGAAQRVLTQFGQDYERLSLAVGRFPKEQQEEFMGMLGGYMTRGVPAKVLLACTRYAGDNLSVEAQILDQRGRVLATGTGSLTGRSFDEKETKKERETPKEEKPIKVSDEAKTYFTLMSRGVENGRGGIELLQEPLRTKVLNPERNDPLSYGVTDLLLGAAADRQKPLIAVLPDSAQNFDIGTGYKTSDFFDQLEASDIATVAEVEGWILVRPFRPSDTRIVRINRQAYGNLIRKAASTGNINLNDLSGFAIGQGRNPGYDSFYLQNLYSLFGSALAGYDLSNWEALRFYGFLGESGRKSMEGKTVAFQSLPKEAQGEFAKLVYRMPSLGFTDEMQLTAPEDSEASSPTMDPTERLPNGVPNETQVTLNTVNEAVVIPQGGFTFPMGAAELASQVAMEERPDLFPWAQENRVGDKFKSATRLSLGFDFRFTPTLTQSLQLWDYQAGGKEVFGRTQLPATFKEQYDTFLKEMRESYKGMKNENQGGRGGPPPPLGR